MNYIFRYQYAFQGWQISFIPLGNSTVFMQNFLKQHADAGSDECNYSMNSEVSFSTFLIFRADRFLHGGIHIVTHYQCDCGGGCVF